MEMVNDEQGDYNRKWKEWKREQIRRDCSTVLRFHNYSPAVGAEEQRYGMDNGEDGSEEKGRYEKDGRIRSESPSEIGVGGVGSKTLGEHFC